MAVETTPRKPPQFMNSLVKLLLRSPFHSRVSNTLMLLTFTGRKSGKAFTLPIGYLQQDGEVLVFTDHKWWKNVQAHPTVGMLIKGKKLQGIAEVVHGEPEVIAKELFTFIEHHPMASRAYNVKLDETKKPIREDVQQAAQRFTLIRIRPTEH